VHEATIFNVKEPALHYVSNALYHYHVFKKIIREENIDVVVAAHILAGVAAVRAAKKYNVPVLFDLKDWFPDSAAAYYTNPIIAYILKKGVWAITKYALDGADMITTVSPNLVEKLQRYGYKSKLITNGVDTDVFHPMDMVTSKELRGYKPYDFVIGFCGAIERWYALKEVIQNVSVLIRENKKVKLLIVGTSLFTNYEVELKELVHELGIEDNVRFEGWRKYDVQPRYIAAMDICLIPLAPEQWQHIALPNKYFEYSACGKPILSSPIPALKGALNVQFYSTWDEFNDIIMDRIPATTIPSYKIEVPTWKQKANEFEIMLEDLISVKRGVHNSKK